MASMVCQHCGENPATFHLTEIKDGKHVVLDYCEACAAAQGLTSDISMPSMLAQAVAAASRGGEHEELTCPHCSMSFREFRKKGRLGCPKDYEVFAEPLEALLRKMHDNRTRHRGRLPSGPIEQRSVVADRLQELDASLQEAIEGERYEEAARIRDEIRTIESRGTDFGPAADLVDPLEL